MQIARWLLRETFCRDGDVRGVWGTGGSLPGDTPASPAHQPSSVPGRVSGHWAGSVPFLHTSPHPLSALGGGGGGDTGSGGAGWTQWRLRGRVGAGDSRPPGSPPGPVLFVECCRYVGPWQTRGKAVVGLACGPDCPLTPAPSSSLKVAPSLSKGGACPLFCERCSAGSPWGPSAPGGQRCLFAGGEDRLEGA